MEEKKKKEEPEKKSSLGWLKELFSFFSEAMNLLVEHSNAEIQKIKKLVVNYVIIYSLFIIALLFILVGAIKYFFPIEGLGFMITGGVMIVALAAYSLIRRF